MSLVEIANFLVGEAAVVEGTCVAWVKEDGLGQVADCRFGVAFYEMYVTTFEIEGCWI